MHVNVTFPKENHFLIDSRDLGWDFLFSADTPESLFDYIADLGGLCKI